VSENISDLDFESNSLTHVEIQLVSGRRLDFPNMVTSAVLNLRQKLKENPNGVFTIGNTVIKGVQIEYLKIRPCQQNQGKIL